jgi:hypothetical protein
MDNKISGESVDADAYRPHELIQEEIAERVHPRVA